MGLGPSSASSARLSPGKRGPAPREPRPRPLQAVPANKAQPTAVVGGFAVSTKHINLTPSTFHPWAPLDSRAGERTETLSPVGLLLPCLFRSGGSSRVKFVLPARVSLVNPLLGIWGNQDSPDQTDWARRPSQNTPGSGIRDPDPHPQTDKGLLHSRFLLKHPHKFLCNVQTRAGPGATAFPLRGGVGLEPN